ncbi:retrovirus-related pol polyprotein from transposon TNT 1-94 [Tanacetum coccineum]
MSSLEDDSVFDFSSYDEYDGAVADMNNLDTTIQVSPIPTIRIHKDRPLNQMIGDLQSATQTRKMSKNLEEHGFVLEPNKTLVDLPNGKRAIDSKWVFKNKKDERGIVIKNKARLVAQGYTQEKGIDYDEVFAPVARIEAIRLFLAYASFKDFMVYQMDVKSAFLYGKIEQEVYVCQPPGFEDPNFPDRVYKVEKALYGLHQAPRAWYETLSTYLLDNGFQKGKIDKTLFIKRHKVKTASIPIETQKPLLKDEDGKEVDVHMYKSMIGSLMYLTSSRPDIMFAVCACARYQVNPKVSYLHKGQPKLGLWYPKDSPFDLVAYTDSDYAGASLDRKSTTGGLAILTDPHHTPTFIQPSTQPQKTQKPRKPKRKDTQVPQPSGHTENVADEAVHKELGYRLVRAATTASSLEAEQDSGNITKTQSKATPNEYSSQGTNSGGGLRRVRKLEKRKRSRTRGLKRLYKVGLTARVKSSGDEASLGEDASKHGRIDAIDANKEITLVRVHDAEQEVVDDIDITLAQAHEELKTTKPKEKGVVIQELGAALRLQAKFDKEERFAREKAKKEEEANIALIETWDDI